MKHLFDFEKYSLISKNIFKIIIKVLPKKKKLSKELCSLLPYFLFMASHNN